MLHTYQGVIMKSKENIMNTLTKTKHAQFKKDWQQHNKRAKQQNRLSDQFRTLEDYVMYRHGVLQKSPRSFKELKTNHYPAARRTTPVIPSITDTSNSSSTARREPQRYTGSYVTGIATMHKSNLIPITSKEQAIDVSRMRRN